MRADGEGFDVAISFLGTGDYRPGTYVWNGRECRTQYFPVAVCHFFAPTELLVLATDPAQQKHGEHLTSALGEAGCVARCTFVSIPECRTEPEMWALFDVLTQQLIERASKQIVLDVTHGYRSLPMLSLIAAAYLRVAAGVMVSKLVYGAFDAKENDRTPVFDLTPFLALLEWTSATEQFVRTGDAEPIAALLERAQDAAYQGGSALGHAPHNLKPAAAQVRALSQSLQVLRPAYAWRSAEKLDEALRKAKPEIRRWAKPFGVLLGQVRDVARQFVPQDASDPIGTHLEVRQRMLEWYLKHRRYVEAGLLMREMIVSWVAAEAKLDLSGRGVRLQVEEQLNARSRQARGAPDDRAIRAPAVDEIAIPQEIVKLWDQVTNLRNNLAHAKDDMPPDSVIKNVRELAPKVQALAQPEQLHGGIQQ